MPDSYKFDFDNLRDLRQAAEENEYKLPVSEKLDFLAREFKVGDRVIPNSLCVNPMEGRDADHNGAPSSLTFRKYKRFAAGGAGIIWVEATAVTPSGKSHPRQLHINEESLPGFSQLVDEVRETFKKAKGSTQSPLIVLQLTHSGRHSAPEGKLDPIIAKHSRRLDKKYDIPAAYPVISDSQLERIKKGFKSAAKLSLEAGFDAVDIKSCHGYLLHELLFSYKNPDSKYRGKFSDRTAFLRELVSEIKDEFPDLLLASRLSVYDNIPYPDGWGVKKDGKIEPDLSEPFQLIEQLQERGLEILNLAFGNPYYDPFLERPYDQPLVGDEHPGKDPLAAISTNVELTAKVAREFPNLVKVGGGFSWLRGFFQNVAAGLKERELLDSIGAGRLALADPAFASKIIEGDGLSRDNACVTCSSCSQMMQDDVEVGCLIRDGEIYRSSYRNGRKMS